MIKYRFLFQLFTVIFALIFNKVGAIDRALSIAKFHGVFLLTSSLFENIMNESIYLQKSLKFTVEKWDNKSSSQILYNGKVGYTHLL